MGRKASTLSRMLRGMLLVAMVCSACALQRDLEYKVLVGSSVPKGIGAGLYYLMRDGVNSKEMISFS